MRTSITDFYKNMRTSFPLAGLVLVLVYCLFGLGLFHEALTQLIFQWSNPDYTYCYFMPLIIAYMIYEKRKIIQELPVTNQWVGIVPLVLGIFMYWMGELGGEFYTIYVSFVVMLVGITILHIGCARSKNLVFIFVLMILMFPFPHFIYLKLSFNLQLISSQLGTGMVQLLGLPAFREGNVIDLGFRKLEVVEACSGIRYLLPLVVLGLIIAYFVKGSIWKKIFLIFSTIPLAVFMNGTRITFAALSSIYLGPKISDGILHDFYGFVVFMASFAMLTGEAVLLGKLGKRFAKATDAPQASDPQSSEGSQGEGDAVPHREPIAGKRNFPWQPQSAVVLFLLIATLILGNGINFREAPPTKKPFAQLPLDIGTWHGKRAFLDADTISNLHFSDYAMIDYVNPEGKLISLYVAYYESQRKGASIHSPETCLPAGGWTFNNAGLINLPEAGQQNGPAVNRVIMEKANGKEVAYFWFPLCGRIVHDLWQVKLYNFWDAVTLHRTDGALVRIITPLSPGENAELGDKRLQEFTSRIFPILQDFLPGREDKGNH